MVVLINKLPNFHQKTKKTKLDHCQSLALQSFHSTISNKLHKLFSQHQQNGLNYPPSLSLSLSLSLSWYIPCFRFLQGMNKAFAKLVNDLDYPVTKWKGKLAEDYFTYTLNMLDSLNIITCLISHVGMSRLSLSHGVSLITTNPNSAVHHLKPIILKKAKALECKEISKNGSFKCGKERVIHEALMKMRSVDMLMLKVLTGGLSGESNNNEENGSFNWGEFEGFDMGIGQGFVVVKEVTEVNEAVKKVEECLNGGKKKNKSCEETAELKRKISDLEISTEIVGKEVNSLFSEVLSRRNELINCFRLPKSI